MIDSFKPFLLTTQDVRTFRQELELLEQALYKRQAEVDSFLLALKEGVRVEVAQTFEEVLASGQVDKENLIKALLAYLDGLRILQIILPLQPSEGFVLRLYEWVKVNVGVGYVLDLVSDRQLLAGVRIVHNGKYLDYSLNRRISTMLPDKVAEAYAAISNAT